MFSIITRVIYPFDCLTLYLHIEALINDVQAMRWMGGSVKLDRGKMDALDVHDELSPLRF